MEDLFTKMDVASSIQWILASSHQWEIVSTNDFDAWILHEDIA